MINGFFILALATVCVLGTLEIGRARHWDHKRADDMS